MGIWLDLLIIYFIFSFGDVIILLRRIAVALEKIAEKEE